MHGKKADFARLRYCRLLFSDIRSKTINANDNFANDNADFAPVAAVA